MNNGFKVLILNIVNNRLVKAFKARLNGGHLEIAGKKGTGKTTATSVLWEIMTPGKDRITHGEKKSVLTAILSDGVSQITATRTYLPSGSTTSIMKQTPNEDGVMETVPINHKDFKAMLSSLSSNPQDIRNMKAKDKVALLLESAGIPRESYEALDAEIARTSSELGDAQSIKKRSVPGEEPEKANTVNSEALAQKISSINDNNSKYTAMENELDKANIAVEDRHHDLRSAQQELEDNENEIARLSQRIKTLNTEMRDNKTNISRAAREEEEAKKRASEIKESLDAMRLIPPEEISKEVERVSKLNEIANRHKDWEKRVAADRIAGENLGKAQKAHKAALKAKKKVMDGAEFPLDGLSIDDGDLWYNGILVDNLGTSEQMLVYGSLAIEDALSHDIRAVRMDGIESMGQEDYDKLRDLATEKGVQLFATRVTWEEKVLDTEILIVDGHYPEEDEKE